MCPLLGGQMFRVLFWQQTAMLGPGKYDCSCLPKCLRRCVFAHVLGQCLRGASTTVWPTSPRCTRHDKEAATAAQLFQSLGLTHVCCDWACTCCFSWAAASSLLGTTPRGQPKANQKTKTHLHRVHQGQVSTQPFHRPAGMHKGGSLSRPWIHKAMA